MATVVQEITSRGLALFMQGDICRPFTYVRKSTMTDEQLKLFFDNQRVILEGLTYLILRDDKTSKQEALVKLQDIQKQWIETMQASEKLSS
jgi:hypothetical protein